MQGYGRSLWLMHGMFKANGGCGYVKKPDFLLKNGSHHDVFDPKAKLEVKATLKVSDVLLGLMSPVDNARWLKIPLSVCACVYILM